MIGYKGFDKNFRCRDMQYAVGQTYALDGQLKICEHGLHFCDTPLAVFEFYSPANSRFAIVEALGDVVSDKDNPHKFCTDKLKVVRELSLIEFVAEIKGATTNTGNWSAATNTGDCSVATNTGNYSTATNTGDRSTATNTGDFSTATNMGNCSAATCTGNWSAATVEGTNSVAVVTGRDSKAKANIGSWLVLSEWQDGIRSDVQVFKVDGLIIKPDTFYTLKDGLPVEVQEDES